MSGIPYMKGTVMTDEKKDDEVPTIQIGIAVMPVCLANYSTEDGKNTHVDNIMQMLDKVLNETSQKLLAASNLYCGVIGVKMETLNGNVLNQILQDAIKEGPIPSYEERVTKTGIVTDDNKCIFDQDYVAATSSGERTDN